MRTVYFPGGNPAIVNDPSFPVCTTLTKPLGPVAVTLAFGTAAPEGSSTCPFKIPGAWARSAKQDKTKHKIIQRIEEIIPRVLVLKMRIFERSHLKGLRRLPRPDSTRPTPCPFG